MTSIARFRRLPVTVTNPDDSVIAVSVGLRCTRCGFRWQASLGQFGDEVPANEARCPHCATHNPEGPRAA